jgi:hypothetical protein
MPEDRSLDEFGGEGDGEAGGTERGETAETDPVSADDDGSEPADGGGSPVVEDPEPATVTSTWTAGGTDCERCGERVERRWLDDGDRVCPDCKPW